MAVETDGHLGTIRPGKVIVCRIGTGSETWSGLLLIRRGDGAESEAGVHTAIDRGVDGQVAVGKHHFVIDTATDPVFYAPDQAYLGFLYGDPVGGEDVQDILACSFTIDTEAP